MFIWRTIVTSVFCMVACQCSTLRGESENRHAQEAKKKELAALEVALNLHGVEMSNQGIRKYLRSLNDPKRNEALARRLIRQLGSEQFAEREAAQKALTNLPGLPIELLEREIANGGDFEVVFRAKAILKIAIPAQSRTVEKTLRAIALLELEGLAPEIFATAEKFQHEPKIVRLAQRAAPHSATGDDIPFLSEYITPESDERFQEMAIESLRAVADESLADSFLKWSENDKLRESIRVGAAIALADLGDRRALDLLASHMVHSKSLPLRSVCHVALREFTQQEFEYSPNETEETRVQQAKRWQAWIAALGKSAPLHFPLRRIRSYRVDGVTLVAQSGDSGRVVKYDEAMREIWSFKCSPWSAEKMDNGNVMIVDFHRHLVLEVGPDENVVRQHVIASSPRSARPLPNGGFLTVRGSDNSILEFDVEGKQVWRLQIKGRYVRDAIRQANGNTLVSGSLNSTNEEFVGEFERSGKLVWEYRRPLSDRAALDSLQLLNNGNVLISVLRGYVLEVDRSTNQVVWRHDIKGVRDAYRLDNGNTLILTKTRLLEVNADGQEIWSKPGMTYGSVRR